MMFKRIRQKLEAFIERPFFTQAIIILILLNAVVLGLEAYPSVMSVAGPMLLTLDQVLLAVFVAELGLRLLALGPRFFRNPWNIFDFLIVAISLLPASGAFSILRALRILRVLRLVSLFPSLRRVIEGIVLALPGIGSIGALLGILYFVSAVMATKLFGGTHPQWFGDLNASLFSLFQIMTLEGWADMVRDLSQTHLIAIPFFIAFILVATFTVLNLFIGVMLDALQRVHDVTPKAADSPEALDTLCNEVKNLRVEIQSLSTILKFDDSATGKS